MAGIGAVVLVAVVYFGATGFVITTRRCRKCKGAKYVRSRRWGHRRCNDLCPRCGGKGRELRAAARTVQAAQRARHRRRPA